MLPQSFFEKDALVLAPRLLGCILIHKTSAGTTAGRIVETECYSEEDAASHSYKGETLRTKAMFGPGGHAYIYFTYGMHYCFNVVSGPKGKGQGILIRALEPIEGTELMAKRRNKRELLDKLRNSHLSARGDFSLRSGQNRTLGTVGGASQKKIVSGAKKSAGRPGLPDRRLTGTELVELCNGPAKLVQAMGITKDDYGKPLFKGNLFIKDRNADDLRIESGPRIGIKKAIDKPWRFWISDSQYVSR